MFSQLDTVPDSAILVFVIMSVLLLGFLWFFLKQKKS